MMGTLVHVHGYVHIWGSWGSESGLLLVWWPPRRALAHWRHGTGSRGSCTL